MVECLFIGRPASQTNGRIEGRKLPGGIAPEKGGLLTDHFW